MKLIDRLSDWVYSIEKVLAMLFGLLIMISLSAGVIFRYVMSSPLTWSDEMAMFSLVWLTFIGGSMSIKVKSAPTIDMLISRLQGGTKKAVLVSGYIAMVLFIGYVLYLSIGWISSPNIFVQHSGSMGMPMLYPYLSIPVSFLFMLVHSLDVLVKSLASKDAEVI
ncbi:TRAP transporter small permease [Virgibacillus ainsalahensis]